MSETPESPPTELVGGKYRLTRMLGKGGMGSVWEGVHVSLGTHVAVKFIETEYVDSHEARSRFENEARAAAKLASKHVVKVHDHGVMNDGRPFIVMEYLSGEPLDVRLNRVGRLSIQETAVIVQQVSRALNKAHEVGIVHRDLKPENVFLVRDDEDGTEIAKVVDFGIAKFTDASGGLSSSTRTGSVLGTPYYMSPEQARGLRSVDTRSDLWSLAVIAYRSVVGELPFVGEAVGDLLVQICVSPTPVPSQKVPGLPPAFDAWVARGLGKEPGARFQTAAEMAEALTSVAGGARAPQLSMAADQGAATMAAVTPEHTTPYRVEGVTAAPFTTQNEPPKKKSPVVLVAGAGVLAVLVLGVGVAVAVRAASGASASADPVVAVGAPPEVSAAAQLPGTASVPPSIAPAVEPPPSASADPAPPPDEKTAAKPSTGGSKPTTGGSKPTTSGSKPTTTGGKPTAGTKPTTGPDIGY
ncbi:MAG: protein kinase [Polyangiaceae bacterium]|nr:protein kinase [Polyangiaceae bacterium]